MIVAGTGGARADFVAGWLGTLPGFVNSRWIIDPETGVSYGYMGDLRAIDQNQKLESVLSSQGLVADPEAEFTWAVSCHGDTLASKDFQSLIDSGAVRFAWIDCSRANPNTIAWEFYVKTYLSHRRAMDSVKGWAEQWVIGNNLSDREKTQRLQKMLKNHQVCYNKINLPCVQIDYVETFCAGGSRYLCQCLGLSASDKHHQYWDSVLPFSQSPSNVRAWGVEWRQQDWFPD